VIYIPLDRSALITGVDSLFRHFISPVGEARDLAACESFEGLSDHPL
jgi:hypothetical protein